MTPVKDHTLSLAATHSISYTETPNDRLADTTTRLSGDDLQLDDIELLLIAFLHAGIIDGRTFVDLLGGYLDETMR